MNYSLEFHPKALKEWNSLNQSIKIQFHKKLLERLGVPRIPKDKLSGFENVYKIKLKSVGYRMAYEVIDEKIVVRVITVGKRENDKVYNSLKNRI